MPERLTPEQRSRNMSRIRAKDTGVELALRRALHKRGLRFRLRPDLPGTPDLTFPRARVSVFVDGCFWHRCPAHYQSPARNADYWKSKVARNVERDRRADRGLVGLGWTVIRVWEHEVESSLTGVLGRIESAVAPGRSSPRPKRRGRKTG